MVDVQDFMNGGNVNVKSVQDRQLTVEGQMETQKDGERYKKHFHRRFVLPRDIYSDSVTSVVSADGVLTITAPKKVSFVLVCLRKILQHLKVLSRLPVKRSAKPCLV